MRNGAGDRVLRETLINRSKVEGRRTGKLRSSVMILASLPTLICVIGTATSFSTEEAAKRKDKCRRRGMVEINQNIFDLALLPINLLALALPAKAELSIPAIGRPS